MHIVAQDTCLPVAAARAGDSDAWDALFRRYQLPLYTYLRDLLGSDQPSLDLLQETFVRAVHHVCSLRDDDRFGSWLFGIAHQLVLQHWRRQGRCPILDVPVPEDLAGEASAPGDELVRRENEAVLLAAIDQLPAAQRAVVLLHYLEDFSLAEIAEITGSAIGTVKSRLYYAKRVLRELLEKEID